MAGSEINRDDLDAQLREMGYLQDPLARFLSAAPGSRPGLLRSYVLVGAKVGVVLGLLLFTLLALGFALVGHFILVDLRDRLLFHLYLLLLTLPLGLVVGLVLAGLFALYSSLRRRTFTKVALAARKCGWIIAILVLVYLLLLWARLRQSLPRWGSWSDLGAALVCVVVALFTGRAVFSAALYLGSWRRRWDPLEAPPRHSGLVALLALVVLTVMAFGTLRTLAVMEAPVERRAQPFEVRGEGRVLWIGVDGLDLAAVRSLAAEGRLPCLERLLREGVVALLASGAPRHPLTWWTDLSTGMDARRHGVRAPTHSQPRGISGALYVDHSMVGFFELLDVVLPLLRLSRCAPLSAALVLEKALPEIVADGGRRPAAVNWWMTHPVDPSAGAWVLSERAIWLAWGRLRAGDRHIPPQEVSPAELRAIFLGAVRLPEEMRAEAGACLPTAPASTAEYSARALDESAVAVAEKLLDRQGFSSIQVGLWGANVLLDALNSALVSQRLSDRQEVVRRMAAYYESLDRRLARLLAACEGTRGGARPLVCLTAASEARRGEDGAALREDGFALFWGAGVRSQEGGAAPRRATPFDVLPTLLGHLGYPCSEEMRGHPLARIVTGLAGLRRISSFGPPAPRALPSSAEDLEALEMFRALGYL